jgi:Na+-transporting NADH:ubiquinone oxidoreductase subunit C
MKVNKDNTGYIFLFTFLLIGVVAVILSSLATSLAPQIAKNNEVKKQMDLLQSIGIESTRANAKDLFEKYISSNPSYVINSKGEIIEGAVAFDIDIRTQHRDKSITEDDKKYPLFIANKEGETLYIVPMVGKGLWGPIWGYVSLKDDKRTIYGVSYDHLGETPGLGAEIKQKFFTDRYLAETVADEELNYMPIKIVKDGSGAQPQKVDGITGGTITSKGVEEMVNRTMAIYLNYLKTI